MLNFERFLKVFAFLVLFGAFSALSLTAGIYLYLKPELPSMETLKDIHFQIPLRVYTQDKKLIAEFGEKRRTPVTYDEVPDKFVKAVLAAEDSSFFKHSGVDIKGLTRAVKLMIQNRGSIKGGGGSTITMQLTRALFLNKDRKFKRKFKEIILAIQLENELSKEEILELYFNEIYLGKRAYGIQAAAQVYYDKKIDELSLAQLAMIAGLPKAPAANNPVNNPERALERRNWILGRMLDLKFITKEQHLEATLEPLTAKDHGQANELKSPYVAEMIRKQLYQEYGDDIYTRGYKAYATITAEAQITANQALDTGIHQYNERHGYKGSLTSYEIPELQDLPNMLLENNKQTPDFQQSLQLKNLITNQANTEEEFSPEQAELQVIQDILVKAKLSFEEYFKGVPQPGNLVTGLTILIDDENQSAIFALKNKSLVKVSAEDILWASPFIDRNTTGEIPEKISQVLKVGDLVYLRKTKNLSWRLAQSPEVQGALVVVNPNNGAVLALVGGYDHSDSKFNRAVQGGRQSGSSFKPFIYTKALESGFTAASIINDAPVVFEDAALEGKWKPENSGGRFYGPTRLRQALYLSRNLVSIRILRKLGIRNTINSMERFGFEESQLPANLSLSLGSASLSPMQVVTGFSSFANGGYKITPYVLDELHNAEDEIIFKANPTQVCKNCNQNNDPIDISERNLEQTHLEIAETFNSESEGDTSKLEEQDWLNQKPNYAPRIIEERVAFIMDSILADVIKRGTGRRALSLGRGDIRGKTGTTNDQFDAWFTGYTSNLVASAWIGFDEPQTLGRGEFGATAALPIWLSFMENALQGKEETVLPRPDKLVTVKINSKTGEAAKPGDPDAIFEIFREELAPQLSANQIDSSTLENEIMPEQLF